MQPSASSRIPTELLTDIMEQSIDEQGLQFPLSPRSSPFSLTHVCSKWRDVAINHPPLWASLTFKTNTSFCLSPDIIEVILKRSQNLPLDVTIIPNDTDLSPQLQLEEPRHLLRIPSLKQRLRRVELAFTPTMLARISSPPPHWSPQDLDLLNLAEEVRICATVQQPTLSPSRTTINLNGPSANSSVPIKLQRLEIVADRSASYGLVVPKFPTDQLTHLHLYNFEESPTNVLALLASSRNLVSFAVGITDRYTTASAPPGQVNLPYLCDFDLAVTTPNHPDIILGIVLSQLDTPNLHHLKLSYLGGEHCIDLVNLISMNYLGRCPRLQCVHLLKLGALDAQMVMASCHSLQHLEIVTCAGSTPSCNFAAKRLVKRSPTFGIIGNQVLTKLRCAGHVGEGSVEERVVRELTTFRVCLREHQSHSDSAAPVEICIRNGQGGKLYTI